MKRFCHFIAAIIGLVSLGSCDYFYSLDIENQWSGGIYIWSQKTGLPTGDDPQSIEDVNSKWYLTHIDPGDMGSFANVMTGIPVDAEWVVEDVFWQTDVLLVVVLDGDRMDRHWGEGKMSDYVIQKYWFRKDDVVEKDGKTYKRISFPPNEGMKDVEMDPPYGTYPSVKSSTRVR